MSFFYSQTLKTQTLDPSSDIKNSKTRFRFAEDTAYYPNIRLANVGSFGSASHSYNRIAGVLASIRHIRLTSNGVELDACRFANRFMAFQALTNDNSQNCSVNRNLVKNAIGYQVKASTGAVASPNVPSTANDTSTNSQKQKSLGHIDLRRVLPLLEQMPILDTAVFKNLILEIEWETDPRNLIVVGNIPQTVQTPMLIAEEIIRPGLRESLTASFKGAVWNKIEHDVVGVADNSSAVTYNTDVVNQTTQHKFSAFDDKHISRMVIMKSFSDKSKYVDTNAVAGYGDFGSLAVHGESIQIKLNGGNVFPQHLDKQSTRDMMTYDSWGKLNTIPYGTLESVGLDVEGNARLNISGAPVGSATSQAKEVGGQSFFGFSLNAKVGEIGINYVRTTIKNDLPSAPEKDALDIHVYAEVRKQLVLGKNGLTISYV